MTRHLLLAALLAAPLAPTPGGAADDDRIVWEGDLAAALEKAKAQGLPLLVAFNMDGEAANDSMVESVYRDPKVVGRAKRFLCLAASKFAHATAREREREVCSRFGSVSCDAHRQVEKDARRAYLGGRTLVNAPQHVFVAPDGALLFRREWVLSAGQLFELMGRALKEAKLEEGAASAPAAEAFDKAKWLERLRPKPVEALREALERLVALDRPEAQALLEEEYGRGTSETRIEILRATGEPSYERAIPFLLRVAGGRDAELRRHAIVSLEIVGDESAADPLLRAAKGETDKGVLKEQLRAIAKLAPSRKEVADVVLRRAGDADERIRANAVVAAADLADAARAREAARKALADKQVDVRACAVYALGLVGEKVDLARLEKFEAEENDFRVRLVVTGARMLLATEGGSEPPGAYRLVLSIFAGDDIPHDGTWPAPPRPGRRGF